jgi:hypothetical protein
VTDTVGGSEPDPDFDAQFAKLIREVEAGRPAAVHEPSARARMLQQKWRDQPPPTTPWRGEAPTLGDATAEASRARKAKYRRIYHGGRAWARNLVIALIICALVFAVVETRRQDRSTSASNGPQVTETSSPTASSAASHLAANALIPVGQLYPKTVAGANGTTYRLVQAGNLADCIKSDMVGATLAGLFAQSKGCVGGEGALYQDAAKDQFDIIVFTLQDPADAVRIVTDLSMDPTDFEVATLLPPAGSGLKELSATSGIIQQFTSDGNRVGVFMAQWADGRAADYSALQGLLTPLQDAVTKTLIADAKGS